MISYEESAWQSDQFCWPTARHRLSLSSIAESPQVSEWKKCPPFAKCKSPFEAQGKQRVGHPDLDSIVGQCFRFSAPPAEFLSVWHRQRRFQISVQLGQSQ